MSEAEKIGISGGTFDPIHFGHLIIAEEIRETMGLNKVVFIPSGNPPHKAGSRITEGGQRLRMVKSAISSNPFFEASDIEVKREGPTYTVDTLAELKAIYGAGTRLFFITGADVVHDLLSWKDYERVFALCEFVAVLRPGYGKSSFLESVKHLNKNLKAVIHTVEAPLIGISSTIIRERVGAGKSVKYLVPEDVEDYIRRNGLYMGREK